MNGHKSKQVRKQALKQFRQSHGRAPKIYTLANGQRVNELRQAKKHATAT